MTSISSEAANFGWLLDNFVRTVPGTRHTLVVSADGLLMAMSDNLDRTSGDQLAAIVAGLSSLTRGAARQLQAGDVRQAIVEMDELFLFLMSVSNGSVLAVVADTTCDVGLIGEPIKVRFGIIDNLTIGNLEIANVPVAIMPAEKMKFFVKEKKSFASQSNPSVYRLHNAKVASRIHVYR